MTIRKFDLEDYLVLWGIGFIAMGLWILQPWISLTVTGILVLAIGIKGALK